MSSDSTKRSTLAVAFATWDHSDLCCSASKVPYLIFVMKFVLFCNRILLSGDTDMSGLSGKTSPYFVGSNKNPVILTYDSIQTCTPRDPMDILSVSRALIMPRRHRKSLQHLWIPKLALTSTSADYYTFLSNPFILKWDASGILYPPWQDSFNAHSEVFKVETSFLYDRMMKGPCIRIFVGLACYRAPVKRTQGECSFAKLGLNCADFIHGEGFLI